MRELGTPLRGVVAILFAAAGALHLEAAVSHDAETVLRTGFAAVASLQVAVAGVVLRERRPARALLAGAIVMQVVAVGLWLLSRTRGLPDVLVPGGHVEPVGLPDAICVLFELASVPATMLLLSPALRTVPLRSAGRGRVVLAGTALVTAALVVPALAADGRAPLRLDADVVAQLVDGGHDASKAHVAGGDERHGGSGHRGSRSTHQTSGADHDRSAHAARGEAHATGAGAGHTDHPTQAATSHAGHAPAADPHAGHRDRGQGRGGGSGSGSGGHHHHDPAPTPAPAPAQATAASSPPPSPPPPGPCDPGAPGATTVADAGGTRVVVQPGSSGTGGTPVHVCR